MSLRTLIVHPPSLSLCVPQGKSIMWTWRGLSEQHNIVHVNNDVSLFWCLFWWLREYREQFYVRVLSLSSIFMTNLFSYTYPQNSFCLNLHSVWVYKWEGMGGEICPNSGVLNQWGVPPHTHTYTKKSNAGRGGEFGMQNDKLRLK